MDLAKKLGDMATRQEVAADSQFDCDCFQLLLTDEPVNCER